MPTVETVRGPVDSDALGRTLMHEHILIMQPEALRNYGKLWGPSYWDEEERVADAIAKLGAVRDAGIETLVDPTAPGLGRDVARIQRINEAVDLNIVVASGVYAFLELPNFLTYRSAGAIAEIFVREISEGINDTGVKAAFLKCAVEREIAASGAWLGCDRFGIDHFNPLADRIRTLVALVEAGYADRVHLSHDAACFFDFMTGDPFFADETADYLLISNEVLPALLEAGVTGDQIDQMMVDNPRRFFSPAG